MAYLDDHPPARSQQRCPRREAPSGVVVLHSAENVPDLDPPDSGAEAVAKFIVGRSDPGSYHWICDSDSRIPLVSYGCEAFQDGTGSNPHAVAISGAFREAEWPTLPADFRAGVVEQMAQAAVDVRIWLAARGVDLPARLLTRDESEARIPGFITHALRDPARRTDPGAACAARVVARYAELIAPPSPEPDPEEPDVEPTTASCTDSGGRCWFFYIASMAGNVRARCDEIDFPLDQPVAGSSEPGVLVALLHAVAGSGGKIDLYGRGTDRRIWRTHNDGLGWAPWVAV